MIKKVVYMIVSPLQSRDYKRFGIAILENNGFEVEVYDYSPIVFPVYYEKGEKRDRSDRAITYFDEEKALKKISELDDTCFAIPLMIYNRKTSIFFRALSDTKSKYAISLANNVPLPEVNLSMSERLVETMKRAGRDLLKWKYAPKYAYRYGVRAPDIVIAGGADSLIHSYMGLADDNTSILWAHTYDYDIHLEDIENDRGGNNSAVYLDIPGPKFERDALTMNDGKSPFTVEKYYPALCNLFQKIEDELGLKVVIAGHPGAAHDKYPDYFGGRRTEHGKTYQMVKQSRLVVCNHSAAVIFAVILKKPVIFFTSDEAEARPYTSAMIRLNAKWLGKEPINIDRVDDLDLSGELEIDGRAYSRYREAYIKRGGSEETNTWQLFANRLKLM